MLLLAQFPRAQSSLDTPTCHRRGGGASFQGTSSVAAKGAYGNVTEELFVLTFVAFAASCLAG